MQLASHPGGSRNTPCRFMLQKPGISKCQPGGPSRLVADLSFTLLVAAKINCKRESDTNFSGRL